MTSAWSCRSPRALATALWLFAACSEPGPEGAPREGTDGGMMMTTSEAGMSQLPSGASQASKLTVTLEAGESTLCAGACTVLRAKLAGPAAEYELRWNNGLSDATEQRVCPASTTRYELDVATRPSAATELQNGQSATADLTIEVRTDCADGGAPPPAPVASCQLRIPVQRVTTDQVGTMTTFTGLDDAGNLYLAGDLHNQRIQVGSTLLQTSVAWAADLPQPFLIKLDSACQPLWARMLPFDNTFVIDMAVDGAGNIALLTDEGIVAGAYAKYRTRLRKLDSNGQQLWSVPSSTAHDGSYLGSPHTVAFAPNGSIASNFLDLCSPSLESSCASVFTADGSYRWSVAVEPTNIALVFDAQSNLIISGDGTHQVLVRSAQGNLESPLFGFQNLTYVTKVSASGKPLWVRVEVIDFGLWPSGALAAAATKDGRIIRAWLTRAGEANEGIITRQWQLTSEGNGTPTQAAVIPESHLGNSQLHVSTTGDAYLLHNQMPTYDNAPRPRVDLRRIAADGTITRLDTFEASDSTYPATLRVRSSDDALSYALGVSAESVTELTAVLVGKRDPSR